MKEILFGVTLPQFTADRNRFIDGVRRAESCHFDSIWLFDHLWPLSGSKQRPILECWTALAWVAEQTREISIGTLVTRSSLRNPMVLAHMARTVADIAPGRLILGIGSGDNKSRSENEAFGIPYWSGADRITQFEETVCLLRRELEGSGIRIWVAGRSDDALSLAARHADAWNGWAGTAAGFARDASTVSDYARDRAVELTWGGVLPTQEPAAAAATLQSFVAAGARHLVCTYPEPWRPGVYEELAEDVRPWVHLT